MTNFRPYPAHTQWTFRSRQYSGVERTTPLHLSWEVSGDPITDDYTSDEISAQELWDKWFPEYAKDGTAKIYWSVGGDGTFEAAPFSVHGRPYEHFLSIYTWPVHTDTEEPLNWARLPVRDKVWNRKRADKGGFIQELTGWKPSPFEPVFHAETIAKAAGLMR